MHLFNLDKDKIRCQALVIEEKHNKNYLPSVSFPRQGKVSEDNDEFRFNNASTYEDHLLYLNQRNLY